MRYCHVHDREAEQIDCPENCWTEPHEHWRCVDGCGWMMIIPADGGMPVPFFDLTQPARLI